MKNVKINVNVNGKLREVHTLKDAHTGAWGFEAQWIHGQNKPISLFLFPYLWSPLSYIPLQSSNIYQVLPVSTGSEEAFERVLMPEDFSLGRWLY